MDCSWIVDIMDAIKCLYCNECCLDDEAFKKHLLVTHVVGTKSADWKVCEICHVRCIRWLGLLLFFWLDDTLDY